MTLVSFASESEPTSVGVPSLDMISSKAGSRRFNLRKRSYDQEKMNLSSYNSAFLDGLFADVAKASSSEDEEDATFPFLSTTLSDTTTSPSATPDVDSVPVTQDEARLDNSASVKRSRVSLTKSFSRCARSFKNLAEVVSPGGVDSFPIDGTVSSDECSVKTLEPNCSASMERMDSLHFQLNCVVGPSASPKSVKSVVDIIDMAFPNLPATISNSSCNKQQELTQCADQQVSDNVENNDSSSEDKESYGWFVELESDEDDLPEAPAAADPHKSTSSSLELAFSAPTAPKRDSNYDAEVEWAKAADTVDDVLGDFF